MKGVISAGQQLTAAAGMEMLERGGNAFDAAVAASFASFVCESPLTSMGGGGFFMAHSRGGETLLYDFFPDVPGRGRAASRASLDFHPIEIDFTSAVQQFHIGRGAAAVPGCMAGFARVHRHHCALPLTTLLEPAIRYARDGFVLNAQQAYFHRTIIPILTLTEEGRAIYAPRGTMLGEGERVFMREMADTMEYLAVNGLERFYDGEIAEKIVKGFGEGGLITREDLKSYETKVRTPLEVSYRGRRIFLNPPPSSSGGALVAFSLKLLEQYDVGGMGHNSAEYLKLLYEVMRVTDLARTEAFDERVYEEGIAGKFLADRSMEEYRRMLAEFARELGLCDRPATGNTTHISVADEEGNAASVTTSNGEGCGHMIPGMGVMLNNMLGEDDINPHGFHALPAGTRMSSMMAPTIVMRGDVPEVVLGTGGSSRIRNAIVQVIVNLLDHGLSVADAVNEPRVHWDRAVFQAERGVEATSLDLIERTGVPVNRWHDRNMYFGGVHTVVMAGERPTGAGDSRRGGVCLASQF
ncbi:MAG: gamma-glutamyltransferase [Nitrospirota bacterium]|nr:gamma-glutamyltransferase [Nitrospirota bacterium]